MVSPGASQENAFKEFFEPISFSGDNEVYCERCDQKTTATTECDVETYPQILTLLLKRFDFNYSTGSNVKVDRLAVVPRTLQRQARGHAGQAAQNVKYELYGMVNHIGSLRGGHYTATIQSNENQIWYEFDDSYVSEAHEQPFAKGDTYKSQSAYLLIYRRVQEPEHLICDETRPEEHPPSDEEESRPSETTALLEHNGEEMEQNEEDEQDIIYISMESEGEEDDDDTTTGNEGENEVFSEGAGGEGGGGHICVQQHRCYSEDRSEDEVAESRRPWLDGKPRERAKFH
ncbi:ubiquitin carboxyl-terminal hydrolase 33-like [Polymixia lowei]